MSENQVPLKQSIPVRLYGWEENEVTGNVVILRPKFVSKLGQKYLLPFFSKKNFKVKLDDLGTAVWKNCDGDKTVEDIKSALDKSFPGLEDLDQRLNKFITQLYRQNFINLVQKFPVSDNKIGE